MNHGGSKEELCKFRYVNSIVTVLARTGKDSSNRILVIPTDLTYRVSFYVIRFILIIEIK